MSIKFHSGQTLTLSSTTVQEWLDERTEIEAEKADLDARLANVNDRLHAAFVLLPGLFTGPPLEVVNSGVENEHKSKTLIDHIVDVVRRQSAAPRDIRAQLEDAGVLKPGTSANYLYTALGRAVKRGLIARIGEEYVASKNGGE